MAVLFSPGKGVHDNSTCCAVASNIGNILARIACDSADVRSLGACSAVFASGVKTGPSEGLRAMFRAERVSTASVSVADSAAAAAVAAASSAS